MRRHWRWLAPVFAGCLLAACGSEPRDPGEPEIPTEGITVNGYLWRASLETLSFMPLVDANPAAGALITDWYINPEAPNERMKVSVFILGPKLRADVLRVVVVRQERNDAGIWINQPVKASTQTQIEDAILARARQLRIDSLED